VTALGIDVSSHQGAIDWSKVGRAGVDFAWIKATEGTSYPRPDDEYHARRALHLAQARTWGLRVGLYHFLTDAPAGAQVDHFLDLGGNLDGVVPILDVETAKPHRLPIQEWVSAFVARMPGRSLLVYSHAEFWRLAGGPAHLIGPVYGWHAGIRSSAYTAATGTLEQQWATARKQLAPSTFGGMTNLAVQFTDHARVPGVIGPCDGSAWLGLLSALDQLAAPAGPLNLRPVRKGSQMLLFITDYQDAHGNPETYFTGADAKARRVAGGAEGLATRLHHAGVAELHLTAAEAEQLGYELTPHPSTT
jgi:hypothetical protein